MQGSRCDTALWRLCTVKLLIVPNCPTNHNGWHINAVELKKNNRIYIEFKGFNKAFFKEQVL